MEKYFSTDVLVDILRRLPPSSRRRARLVCRHWHELVDNRTMEMQSRAKLLIWDTLTPLPTPLARDASYHLTEVHGRLGFVQGGHRADVWVFEEGRRWSLRYILGHYVPRPQFTYPGQCVLTVRDKSSFYAHRWKGPPLSSSRRLRHDDVMRVGYRDEGTLVATMMTSSDCFDEGYKTFAYVETKEPLNYYGSS